MKEIIFKFKTFEKNKNFWFLLISSFIFSILRIPSLVEPDWYGDEGIYQVLGMAVRRGALLYRDIWDNKPPMLYIFYAIFDGNLFYLRFLSLIFGVLTVIAFFFLAQKLFKSEKSIYISTIIFAILFGLPLLEGNIANAENFMLLPIILAFNSIFYIKDKEKVKPYILSGLLLSFAFLLKIVAVFDFVALLSIMLVIKFYEYQSLPKFIKELFKYIRTGKIINILKNEFLFVLSFVAPIFLTVLYFTAKGAFQDFYKAVLSQNVGYVGYGNYFLFPMGFMFLKMAILVVLFALIIRFRKLISGQGLIIFIWLLFSLFNALFSDRPYTHYLLVLLPSLCLFFGFMIEKRKLIILNSIVIVVLLFIMATSFHVYAKSLSYYGNYLSFILGKESLFAYQSFFDRRVPIDYNVVDFIKANTNENDNIFLWSDSAQIYALSGKLPPGRYAVAYHITFYKDGIEKTKRDIGIKKPKYIISTKDSNEITNFLGNYSFKFDLSGVKIYERQF